jgi:hypothetical protein
MIRKIKFWFWRQAYYEATTELSKRYFRRKMNKNKP